MVLSDSPSDSSDRRRMSSPAWISTCAFQRLTLVAELCNPLQGEAASPTQVGTDGPGCTSSCRISDGKTPDSVVIGKGVGEFSPAGPGFVRIHESSPMKKACSFDLSGGSFRKSAPPRGTSKTPPLAGRECSPERMSDNAAVVAGNPIPDQC